MFVFVSDICDILCWNLLIFYKLTSKITPDIEIGFIKVLVSLGGGASRGYTLDPEHFSLVIITRFSTF